jgi:peptide/nickel transport system substrate-binding protein
MNPINRSGRILVMGLGALALLAGPWGLPRTGLSQEDAAARAGTDLLKSEPFDRITLTDGTVIDVEPVSPRPLPSPEAAKKRMAKVHQPFVEGNIGLPGEELRVVMPDQRKREKEGDPLDEITIHLLEGEVRDYTVKRASIKSIEYFEDMLLDEGEHRARARDFARAFECYLRIRVRNSGWSGLDDHVNRLLYEEGNQALLGGDGERGLRLLRELVTRRPDYPGAADKLAQAYDRRIARAFALGAYARGRRILHELEQVAPRHAIVAAIRDRFITRARELVQESARRSGGERLDALTEAVRVWPALDEAGAAYAAAFAAESTLDVAVTDLPRSIGPWIQSQADERVALLLYLPILARADDEAAEGKRPGQLAAGLEVAELGRKLIITLRAGISWSDGSRAVSAIDVARLLTDRADATSPQYNARWADRLDRIEIPSAARVEVRLTRPLLKPAAWLVVPTGPAHAGRDGWVASVDRGRLQVGDGTFRWVASTQRTIRLRAAGSASVRRLHETRFPDAGAALGALLRGDVSLVEHVPADRVAGLTADPAIRVGRFVQPALHFLALDGRNSALRNRSLRRGLSYALDRRTLLEETVLNRPPDDANLVSDGPFAKGSYADAPDVEPLKYDPSLARMLVRAARSEMGGDPIKLKLEYPALAEARAVVPRIAEAFKLAGVEITPIERPGSELEAELRAGRRFDLAYRATRCAEPVLEAGGLLCPGYDASPSADALAALASPRVLLLLLQLERAPEWPSARGLAIQIDRECRDELPVLPLWQLVDHYAWRTRLKGPAEVSERLYQGIESWEIEPWFAKDPW